MTKPSISITKNKKAYFDYDVLDSLEAGIVLTGAEIKAVRENKINLKGGFVSVTNREMFLEQVHIGKYSYATDQNYEPKRKRKLLAKKKEIDKLSLQSNQKGITIIPLEVLIKHNLAKVTIGLCRGKKKYDKRDALKQKAQNMEILRSVKRFSR